MVAYLLIGVAVIAEVFGDSMMKLSNGFQRKLPLVGTVVGYGIAFYLIAQALEHLPLGPAARLNRSCEVKRPVHLHVIGAGGDPFGYDALVSIVRSAFGSAGFFIADVVERIGWGQPGEEDAKQRFS